jgi:hypothetical protein
MDNLSLLTISVKAFATSATARSPFRSQDRLASSVLCYDRRKFRLDSSKTQEITKDNSHQQIWKLTKVQLIIHLLLNQSVTLAFPEKAALIH